MHLIAWHERSRYDLREKKKMRAFLTEYQGNILTGNNRDFVFSKTLFFATNARLFLFSR